MDKNTLNIDKRHSKNQKKSGFTLIEAIIAAAIIAFAIFATWRVITSSINSISRQGKKIKVLHIGQACLGRLEGETFSRVVPENFILPSSRDYELESITYNSQIIDKDGSGDANTGDFKLYEHNGTEVSSGWSYDPIDLKIIGVPGDVGRQIYVDYAYYHLIDEGGTVPSSNGEGIKERTIKLTTNVGDTNGNGISGEKNDISGDDLDTSDLYDLSFSDYESFDNNTRELVFNDIKKGHSVWIYYLPQNSADLSGPDGAPDSYQDPTDDSIVGVVQGCFWVWDPDTGVGDTTTAITSTKRITVTEFWRQEEKIKKIELKTFVRK